VIQGLTEEVVMEVTGYAKALEIASARVDPRFVPTVAQRMANVNERAKKEQADIDAWLAE
jgi:hypothetical protein